MAATKLTITIPDDLAEQLEPWRDRMNISKICSKAIAKEVAILADLPRELQELTDVIARLRSEKAESERLDFKTGYESGMLWAKDSSYDELVSWVNAVLPIDEQLLPSWLPEWAEEHLRELLGEGDVVNCIPYIHGWHAGLLSIWKVIREKL